VYVPFRKAIHQDKEEVRKLEWVVAVVKLKEKLARKEEELKNKEAELEEALQEAIGINVKLVRHMRRGQA